MGLASTWGGDYGFGLEAYVITSITKTIAITTNTMVVATTTGIKGIDCWVTTRSSSVEIPRAAVVTEYDGSCGCISWQLQL